MGMAQLVVTAVLIEGRCKSEVARDYGISRRWVITLVQRYLAEGEAGLQTRSRRPLRSPTRTATAVEEEIIAIRKDLDRGGHEAGAATIVTHLQRRHGSAPAVSTVWRILTARGFVTPQPHKRPKSSYVRFAAEQPNERWQTDITHWRLTDGTDGTDVEIINWIDDHSRLCLASTARQVFTAGAVNASYRDLADHYGDPASVLSDNGAVYTGRYRGRGIVALETTLHRRGVVFTHSRPYHPQTCGKAERFHQTEKRWLATQPAAATIPALQRQLDTFRSYYNNQRPHRALARRTPAEAYTARLHRPTQGHRHRTTALRPHPVACPPRHRRHQRQAHPPPRQPPAPHRHRPPPRRHPDPHARPRPAHPDHHQQRATTPRLRTRPHPGLPTHRPNMNDVPRHL